MRRLANYLIAVAFAMAATGILSCGEDVPPASQPKMVKHKIADQAAKAPVKPSGETGPAFAPITEQASTMSAKPQEPGAEAVPESKPPVSDLVKASTELAGGYDATGRFDPFEPLFKNESNEQAPVKGVRKKRTPQTPLERVAISQLKLSAIMRTPEGNSAIVEDATGKGYVVKKGTYIGLNSGQVTDIKKDRILIEEEVENVMGELKIVNLEMKLQKPAGEL
jgi:type IV pilus assembly protein PilP